MDAEALRDLSAALLTKLAEREAQISERDAELSLRDALLATRDKELKAKQLKIDQLTHEMAILRRYRFDRRSEQMDVLQRSLLDECIDADIEAISLEIEALQEKPASAPKEKPRRVALPASFPRREIRHEPENTQCKCGCSLERIGEDVSEKLDYIPGVFEVERHIRGKWVCRACETLIQAPVPPQIIDKGIPTAGLLAQVLIAKYLDHMPLYRIWVRSHIRYYESAKNMGRHRRTCSFSGDFRRIAGRASTHNYRACRNSSRWEVRWR